MRTTRADRSMLYKITGGKTKAEQVTTNTIKDLEQALSLLKNTVLEMQVSEHEAQIRAVMRFIGPDQWEEIQ